MLWARVVRGAASRAKPVRPALASLCRPAASKGLSMPMTTLPLFMRAASLSDGRAHLEHDVAAEGACRIRDLGTCCLVGGIGEAGGDAGAALDAHGMPLRSEFLGRLRSDGHSGFAWRSFGRHAYQHGGSPRGSVGIRAELT